MINKTVLIALSISIVLLTGCSLPQTNLEWGEYYLEKNNFKKAIASLEEAASEDGDLNHYIKSFSLLAHSYNLDGNHSMALSTYRNILQIIQFRLHEIKVQRHDIRRKLTLHKSVSSDKIRAEDVALGDEESFLKEKEGAIKGELIKLKKIL